MQVPGIIYAVISTCTQYQIPILCKFNYLFNLITSRRTVRDITVSYYLEPSLYLENCGFTCGHATGKLRVAKETRVAMDTTCPNQQDPTRPSLPLAASLHCTGAGAPEQCHCRRLQRRGSLSGRSGTSWHRKKALERRFMPLEETNTQATGMTIKSMVCNEKKCFSLFLPLCIV